MLSRVQAGLVKGRTQTRRQLLRAHGNRAAIVSSARKGDDDSLPSQQANHPKKLKGQSAGEYRGNGKGRGTQAGRQCNRAAASAEAWAGAEAAGVHCSFEY